MMSPMMSTKTWVEIVSIWKRNKESGSVLDAKLFELIPHNVNFAVGIFI